MISFFTTIIALVGLFQTPENTAQTNPQPAEIEWKKTTHDFGEIVQGSKSKFTFTFVNKGTTPIVITNATASCGCTVPSYSKEPVGPNQQGTVTAIFDSAGKMGNFVKTITIVTNVGSSYLNIKGNIIAELAKPKSPIQLND
jgi:hypothetical protein